MRIEEKVKPTPEPLMTLAAYSIQGKRHHMEDFFDIGYQMKPCDQRRPNEWPYEYFYLGIFDGHGGREAAQFTKKNLLKYITMETDFWSNDDDDVMRSIRAGFAKTHSAMRDLMGGWSRTNKVLPSTAGTTASILFIKNGKFYTGHVGDSRIVISHENPETKQWIHTQMTDDHKPESEKEVERITRAGGEVRSKMGVHRVVWRRPILGLGAMRAHTIKNMQDCVEQIPCYPVEEGLVHSYQAIPFLAIARSLGDFWSINPYSGQYVVSPEPDVSCRRIRPNDNCILLATDGLWNVMNSSQAIRSLQELNITKNGEREKHSHEHFTTDNYYDVAGKNFARSLVFFAYQIWERKSLRSDNITVVVAMLNDILGCFQGRSGKSYATRSSAHLLDESRVSNLYREPVQIEEVRSFHKEITIDEEPSFSVNSNQDDERWQKFEQFFLLPPTLLAERKDNLSGAKIIDPLNYKGLSEAPSKRMPRTNCDTGPYVYMKWFSDDPADRIKLPSRLNRKKKEVRDASAQATQNIHDFGQPWSEMIFAKRQELDSLQRLIDGLMSDDIDIDFEDDECTKADPDSQECTDIQNSETGIKEEEDSKDVSIRALKEGGKSSDLKGPALAKKVDNVSIQPKCDIGTQPQWDLENDIALKDLSICRPLDPPLLEPRPLDSPTPLTYQMFMDMTETSVGVPPASVNVPDHQGSTTKPNASKQAIKLRESSITSEPIPLMRCLLNSESNARKTRNSYLSMSENAKRKNQVANNTHKSKRRKSQPAVNEFGGKSSKGRR